jgi:hypothetical protein
MALSAPGVAESVWYTHTHPIREISLAFDQNARPVVAFVDEVGGVYLRWFDPVPNAIVNTDISSYARSPRVTLDDNRPLNLTNSDVILGYVRGGIVRYRRQRDRFMDEYTPTIGVGGATVSAGSLFHISMNSNQRLEFIVDGGAALRIGRCR